MLRLRQALLDEVVPAEVVAEIARSRDPFMPGYGLGWWLGYAEEHCIVDRALLDVWAADGVPRWFVEDLDVMVDRRHPDSKVFFEELRALVSKRAPRKWARRSPPRSPTSAWRSRRKMHRSGSGTNRSGATRSW